jgi:hypothetical protein
VQTLGLPGDCLWVLPTRQGVRPSFRPAFPALPARHSRPEKTVSEALRDAELKRVRVRVLPISQEWIQGI